MPELQHFNLTWLFSCSKLPHASNGRACLAADCHLCSLQSCRCRVYRLATLASQQTRSARNSGEGAALQLLNLRLLLLWCALVLPAVRA